MKATNKNESVKPLTICCDGVSKKLELKKGLTVLSFIFPMKGSTSWESGRSGQTWRLSHSWENLKEKSPAVLHTLKSEERRGERLGVEKYWELSQSGGKCLQVFSLFPPTPQPHKEASAEAPEEVRSLNFQVWHRKWELVSRKWQAVEYWL